ncbi:MAG: hypothetical protein ACP5XB_15130 [Isosphaeraceae bacterium]
MHASLGDRLAAMLTNQTSEQSTIVDVALLAEKRHAGFAIPMANAQ